jgi:hypothetical protein
MFGAFVVRRRSLAIGPHSRAGPTGSCRISISKGNQSANSEPPKRHNSGSSPEGRRRQDKLTARASSVRVRTASYTSPARVSRFWRDACVVAGPEVNLRLVQVAVAQQRRRCRCDCRSCSGRTIWHVRSISRRWPLFYSPSPAEIGSVLRCEIHSARQVWPTQGTHGTAGDQVRRSTLRIRRRAEYAPG